MMYICTKRIFADRMRIAITNSPLSYKHAEERLIFHNANITYSMSVYCFDFDMQGIRTARPPVSAQVPSLLRA